MLRLPKRLVLIFSKYFNVFSKVNATAEILASSPTNPTVGAASSVALEIDLAPSQCAEPTREVNATEDQAADSATEVCYSPSTF